MNNIINIHWKEKGKINVSSYVKKSVCKSAAPLVTTVVHCGPQNSVLRRTQQFSVYSINYHYQSLHQHSIWWRVLIMEFPSMQISLASCHFITLSMESSSCKSHFKQKLSFAGNSAARRTRYKNTPQLSASTIHWQGQCMYAASLFSKVSRKWWSDSPQVEGTNCNIIMYTDKSHSLE
jgi:hypothetical protein